jgi:hypothetical protein
VEVTLVAMHVDDVQLQRTAVALMGEWGCLRVVWTPCGPLAVVAGVSRRPGLEAQKSFPGRSHRPHAPTRERRAFVPAPTTACP